MGSVLMAWVGDTDLKASISDGDDTGPIWGAVQQGDYDRLVLLHGKPLEERQIRYKEKQFIGTLGGYRDWLSERFTGVIEMCFHPLESPVDFDPIWTAADAEVKRVQASGDTITLHFSPGTAVMQSVWLLLAKTHDHRLIQSQYKGPVLEVDFKLDLLAEVAPRVLAAKDADLYGRIMEQPEHRRAFRSLIGKSDAMSKAKAMAQRAAPRWTIPVLLEGESGTGKELFASAIHESSQRKGKFIPINCGAIPKDLVESELFGHVKGAFTGALQDKKGVFEQANGGTLFLDELGELPKDAQVKLLRVLQEQKVRRVGDTATAYSVDVRVIAATNVELPQAVARGDFREDLYFRLAVAVIHVPPLRERGGDLRLLIDRFLKTANEEIRGDEEPRTLSVNAIKTLVAHRWPGNVRELQHTIARMVLWSTKPVMDVRDASEAILMRPSGSASHGDEDLLGRPMGEGVDIKALEAELYRHYVARAFEAAGGRKNKAAELLGTSSVNYWNWYRKYIEDQ